MAVLPPSLCAKVFAHNACPVMGDIDKNNGNKFWVVHKGTKSDIDSYGIATENDRVTKTFAPLLFTHIAAELKQRGVNEANIYIGGLATNFCVEYSHNDIHKYLVPKLQGCGIKANVSLLTDISAGIPIAVPDGSWPDLASASKRMGAFGTMETTTKDVIRSVLARPAAKAPLPQAKP